MRLAGRHWALAGTAALLLHLGLLSAMIWRLPDSGVPATGAPGITVTLGLAGDASDASGDPGAPNAAMPAAGQEAAIEEVAEKNATNPPETAPVTTVPPDASPAEPVEAVSPPLETLREPTSEPVAVAEPRQEAVADPAPTPPPRKPTATAAVLERAERKPSLPPRKPLPPETHRVAKTPESAPALSEADQSATADAGAVREAETRDARRADPASGAGGQADAQAERGSGPAGAPSMAGQVGQPGDTADYAIELVAWLERHRKYPRRARLRQQQGTALLFLAVDAEGYLLDFRIEASTGHRLLDQEVVEMIERAKPLPRVSNTVASARFEFEIPISFSLQEQ